MNNRANRSNRTRTNS